MGEQQVPLCVRNGNQKSKNNGDDKRRRRSPAGMTSKNNKGKGNGKSQCGGPSLRSRMTAKNRQPQRQRRIQGSLHCASQGRDASVEMTGIGGGHDRYWGWP